MILGLDPYLWVMRGDLEGVNFFENLEVFVWVCIFHNQKMHVYLVFNLWICIVTGQLPFQLLNERLLSKFKCCLFFLKMGIQVVIQNHLLVSIFVTLTFREL